MSSAPSWASMMRLGLAVAAGRCRSDSSHCRTTRTRTLRSLTPRDISFARSSRITSSAARALRVEVAFLAPSVTILARRIVFEIVGREEELGSLQAFIGRAEGGPAALVLDGEAGIGKSTLWVAGVEHARAGGLRVLTSRPAEAERGLAHVGLGDLFDDVLDDVLPALSMPRRRALEAALLREDASGDPVDQRALAVA